LNSIPDYRAETTTAKVLQALFIALIHEAKSHIPAVLTQNDDEELHRYRVALRKMHSILHEFRRCMDKDIYTLLKYELKAMLAPTNALRDMDVFLADMTGYRDRLKPKKQKGIEDVQAQLKKVRQKDFEGVKKFVKSAEYVAILSVINDLTKEDKFYTACSQNRIETVLKNLMAARYKSIRKEAKKLTKSSAPTAFHALRLSVKKLRYLTDTFAHHFPKEPYASVSDTLRTLQTRLGRLQDIHIQTDRILQGSQWDEAAMLLHKVLQKERKKYLKKVAKNIGKLAKKRFAGQMDALL
jgi:CHAD domain-containing protein